MWPYAKLAEHIWTQPSVPTQRKPVSLDTKMLNYSSNMVVKWCEQIHTGLISVVFSCIVSKIISSLTQSTPVVVLVKKNRLSNMSPADV